MSNPRRFISSTDYPMPFISYIGKFSWQRGPWASTDTRFKHGLPFTPLLIGQWSTNANFNPAYDLAITAPDYTATRPQYASDIGADDTYIYIYSANNTDDTTVTFYYRFIAFAPPEFTGKVTSIDGQSPFLLNSDFNYLKIVKEGSATAPAGGTTNVAHNLGYLPQCRIWQEHEMSFYDEQSGQYLFPKVVSPVYSQDYAGVLLGARITTSNLILGSTQISGSKKFYYHIYADEV